MTVALLALLGTVAATVGGITGAAQQIISLWRSAKDLLPARDKDPYFKEASGEGVRLSKSLADARVAMAIAAPHAEALSRRLLFRTGVISVLWATLVSAPLFILFRTVLFSWNIATVLGVAFVIGFVLSLGPWVVSQPRALYRYASKVLTRQKHLV